MGKRGLKIGSAGMVLALGALVSGCTSIKDHRGYIIDQALVDSVQPGVDNRESVEKTLGRPTFASEWGNKDWYYVSQTIETPAFRSPRTQNQVVLRVQFDPKGNVIDVQRRGMEQVARITPNGDQTPTLGRERSLLQDLFGNIGQVGAAGMGGSGTGSSGSGGSGPNGS
ncbi:outer membrane protein assembly factor BamE [Novosphingobium sp. 1949]|uniref:Outer membrane protein assembly factor BamE n=1 Tax=Novosphingobium organovorum TaxID=2930092 RepID=A0ABT0BFL0_9SPHN|nr:outer membrane protein assembly factor BamE [Novosphingobium organovorum]MCJ2183847.1 outer membrane protein assembly factor BamE [Novosphingobium organovorum]